MEWSSSTLCRSPWSSFISIYIIFSKTILNQQKLWVHFALKPRPRLVLTLVLVLIDEHTLRATVRAQLSASKVVIQVTLGRCSSEFK
jgi:hypothetical protein